MTIELKLSPELESLARAKAEEEFSGDIQALLQTALREYLDESGSDEVIDQLLLEAINTPKIAVPQYWRDMIKKKSAVS